MAVAVAADRVRLPPVVGLLVTGVLCGPHRFRLIPGLEQLEALAALDVDQVVPEEFETSIEISSRVLHRFLVPCDTIEQLTREIRNDAYELLRRVPGGHADARGVQRFLSDISLEVYRVARGSAVAGTPLATSHIRELSRATVVAIQRADEHVIVNPTGAERLEAGDVVLLLGRREQLSAARELFIGDEDAS